MVWDSSEVERAHGEPTAFPWEAPISPLSCLLHTTQEPLSEGWRSCLQMTYRCSFLLNAIRLPGTTVPSVPIPRWETWGRSCPISPMSPQDLGDGPSSSRVLFSLAGSCVAIAQSLPVTHFKNNHSESAAEALLKEFEDIRSARNPTALAQLLFLLGVIRSSCKISPLAKHICSKGKANVCAAKQNILRSRVTMMLNQAESPPAQDNGHGDWGARTVSRRP